MFGGSSKPDASSINDAGSTADDKSDGKPPSPDGNASAEPGPEGASSTPIKAPDQVASGEKRSGNGSPPSAGASTDQKKRRSSGVGNRTNNGEGSSDAKSATQTPLQKLGKQDQALAVPQGQHNNAAGESLPGPRSTFRVGVWEDRNRKCRRTMEDTHAFLYNFLHTPAPALATDPAAQKNRKQSGDSASVESQDMIETDNGYFAIFDGHAGTFAADWCGKKLHIILEEVIRKNPNTPIPELLDQTFTTVDTQLEKLPIKNSGCTAAIAVLRWEDRVPSNFSATGSQAIAPAVLKAAEEASKSKDSTASDSTTSTEAAHAKLKHAATRQRVLYTANVGDARIILCRAGKALRLSYDHKGSDENEGKRIANAGGLILNNRVNGVLAVTRALGDCYMKDLVTGHPYTTETVIQPELDEFIIIACDGLWDVCSDQEAVDLVRDINEPQAAAKVLVDHALARFSTDNLSCMIVRFNKHQLLENQTNTIGVEGDAGTVSGKLTEAEKIVSATKQKIAEGATPAVGVSASNSGRGHDPVAVAEDSQSSRTTFAPTVIDGSVEEEPSTTGDPPEVDTDASAPLVDVESSIEK
ncbi:Protein phosphatase 2C 1 [Coniochaeta pulveracea]|uniref:Protein phosphatase 2C 1 n=1 Tax=Coniochaeta pulveracea TaxID=177199 RepID=A0A420YK02_9PEZI|nr:Protein phosphatase 2C 1 [Coniochaeta pulveracea]